MLSNVFSLKGLNMSDVEESFKVIWNSGPKKGLRPPSWNLDLVLKALVLIPFEPLRTKSFRNLIQKALFLTSLVSAKRVGKLQTWSHRIIWQRDDLLLSYLPEFIAKMESTSNPHPRESRIKNLAVVVAGDEEECLLCLIRTLNILMERMKEVTPRPTNLFVSPLDRSRLLSRNTLSFLLRKTILEAQHSL